ncbi:MAG: hypothetical protein QF570_01395 [Myxococcota bacterium]|jgi:hypothetical protein|nr:hypothetical protein [Myxococcota bacterium]
MKSTEIKQERGPLGHAKSSMRTSAVLIAALMLSGGVAGVAQADEPLTQTFEQRRSAPSGPYVQKQRTTVETLVRALRNGKLDAINHKGGPLDPSKLPQRVQRLFEAALRDFGRAIMPVKRRPSRSVIRELAADPKLKEDPRFEFDPKTGRVKLYLKEELWSATVEFNAFQLGQAIKAGGVYMNSMAENLEEHAT